MEELHIKLRDSSGKPTVFHYFNSGGGCGGKSMANMFLLEEDGGIGPGWGDQPKICDILIILLRIVSKGWGFDTGKIRRNHGLI